MGGSLEPVMERKNIMTKYNEFESVHIVEVGASIGTYTGEGAILVSVL